MTTKIDEDIISSADSAYYTAYGEFLLGNNPVSDIATAIQAERNKRVAEINRLTRERDEARNKALDEAASIAKVQWMRSDYGQIADAEGLCDVCEDAAAMILALKTKEVRV